MGRLKRRLVQYLVKNLLAAVSEEDILTITNRGWFLKNRKLTEEEITQLKEEAYSFRDSVLWGLMSKEVKHLANLQMFEKGVKEENTVFGRAMLYNLQLIQLFIDRCSKL